MEKLLLDLNIFIQSPTHSSTFISDAGDTFEDISIYALPSPASPAPLLLATSALSSAASPSPLLTRSASSNSDRSEAYRPATATTGSPSTAIPERIPQLASQGRRHPRWYLRPSHERVSHERVTRIWVLAPPVRRRGRPCPPDNSTPPGAGRRRGRPGTPDNGTP